MNGGNRAIVGDPTRMSQASASDIPPPDRGPIDGGDRRLRQCPEQVDDPHQPGQRFGHFSLGLLRKVLERAEVCACAERTVGASENHRPDGGIISYERQFVT